MTECKSRSCPGHRWEWVHVRVRMCACVRACERASKHEEEPRTREDIGLRCASVQMHAVMHVPRFGQRGEGSGLMISRFSRHCDPSRRAGSSLLHARPCRPSTASMDERLERGLWVLCPMRASMVESKEPGQRSPRDGGWEADRLTATSRGDDSPMPMSIRRTPDSCVAFGGPCPDKDTVYGDATRNLQPRTPNPRPNRM